MGQARLANPACVAGPRRVGNEMPADNEGRSVSVVASRAQCGCSTPEAVTQPWRLLRSTIGSAGAGGGRARLRGRSRAPGPTPASASVAKQSRDGPPGGRLLGRRSSRQPGPPRALADRFIPLVRCRQAARRRRSSSMPAPCAISPGTRPCARCEAPRAGPSACARVGSCGTELRTGPAPSPCRCGRRSRSRARTRSSRAPHAGRP